jgi:hypothetical protein
MLAARASDAMVAVLAHGQHLIAVAWSSIGLVVFICVFGFFCLSGLFVRLELVLNKSKCELFSTICLPASELGRRAGKYIFR